MDVPPDRREDATADPVPGPHLDIVGDVHGCLGELVALLGRLGYCVRRDAASRPVGATHPGRTAVFVGDLVDRGPDTAGVLRLVMGMVADGDALAVAGNHDDALRSALESAEALRSRPQVAPGPRTERGTGDTLMRLVDETPAFRAQVLDFLRSLPPMLVLDAGRLVVVHAGLPRQPRTATVEELYRAAVLGEVDSDWAVRYLGDATVVHGHTPRTAVGRTGRTICVDTGCVYGGSLSALRYPEQQVLAVHAIAAYGTPTRSIPTVTSALETASSLVRPATPNRIRAGSDNAGVRSRPDS